MVDKLVIVNEDGSFDDPKVEAHLVAVAVAHAGAGAPPLTSYAAQVATLPDYPTGFPPNELLPHTHDISTIGSVTTQGRTLVGLPTYGDMRTLLGLEFVTSHRQLPLVNGEVVIYATGLNTFPPRAANIPAGYTGGVVWKHAAFGTCTVGPSDDIDTDIIEDRAP